MVTITAILKQYRNSKEKIEKKNRQQSFLELRKKKATTEKSLEEEITNLRNSSQISYKRTEDIEQIAHISNMRCIAVTPTRKNKLFEKHGANGKTAFIYFQTNNEEKK